MFSYVTDGTVAILIGSLPLILPNKNPFSGKYEIKIFAIFNRIILENWHYRPILEWSHLSKTFPWGVFMLQGAGLAIADGFKVSRNEKNLSLKNIIVVLGIRSFIYNRQVSSIYCWCIRCYCYLRGHSTECSIYRIHKQSCLCQYSISNPWQYCKLPFQSFYFNHQSNVSLGNYNGNSCGSSYFTILHGCFSFIYVTYWYIFDCVSFRK